MHIITAVPEARETGLRRQGIRNQDLYIHRVFRQMVGTIIFSITGNHLIQILAQKIFIGMNIVQSIVFENPIFSSNSRKRKLPVSDESAPVMRQFDFLIEIQ